MTKLALRGSEERYQAILSDLNSDIGRKITGTSYFKEALGQTHHNKTTVALHTLGVTASALRLYYFLTFFGLKIDKDCLLTASLCHDFGIIGRYEKFENNLHCYRQHPADSVTAAKEIFPDLDLKTEDCIRCHMFPGSLKPPASIEGVILTLADKYCAVIEGTVGTRYCPGMPFIDKIEYSGKQNEKGCR